jgi:hypothetical protein
MVRLGVQKLVEVRLGSRSFRNSPRFIMIIMNMKFFSAKINLFLKSSHVHVRRASRIGSENDEPVVVRGGVLLDGHQRILALGIRLPQPVGPRRRPRGAEQDWSAPRP